MREATTEQAKQSGALIEPVARLRRATGPRLVVGVAALGEGMVGAVEQEWSASDRKPARRRRVEGGRQHRHVVRVTAEEEARLVGLAAEFKVSVAKLLVDSALAAGSPADAGAAASGAPVVDRAVAVELFAAVRQLAGIATNVNQIARKANTTGEVAVETPATLRAVRDAAARIEAVLGRLSVAGS